MTALPMPPPPEPVEAAAKPPKSNAVWWVLGGLAVLVGGYFLVRGGGVAAAFANPVPKKTLEELERGESSMRLVEGEPPAQKLNANPLGRGNTLDPELIEKYKELAYAQRGEPEEAMGRAQRVLGGGVMSFVIEHVGDLTNRMAKDLEYGSAGYGNVEDKVSKTLRSLKHDYGFEREHEENMRSNAEHRGVSYEEHMRKVDAALRDYAQAHAHLRVYNRAQHLARQAAVALGLKDFKRAREALEALKRMLNEGEEKWWEYATAPPDPKVVAAGRAWLPWEKTVMWAPTT